MDHKNMVTTTMKITRENLSEQVIGDMFQENAVHFGLLLGKSLYIYTIETKFVLKQNSVKQDCG